MNQADFRPGLYQHYKGAFYYALFLLTHHDTGEVFVAYVSQDHLASGVRLREWASSGKDSWTDRVVVDLETDDGVTRRATVQRFEWVGP